MLDMTASDISKGATHLVYGFLKYYSYFLGGVQIRGMGVSKYITCLCWTSIRFDHFIFNTQIYEGCDYIVVRHYIALGVVSSDNPKEESVGLS